ncbi:MAG: hypothetical protein M1830_005281 [Pleopsidium flavum]|nr:MAG: hypothetical protein M1830_005281 [Pleopsidium flavum]
MGAGRDYYALETRARRDGYVLRDCEGGVPFGGSADPPGDDERERGPEMLQSTVVNGRVLRAWQDGVPDFDVRLSDDAGRYLCDFTYYTSLLEFWRRGPEGERPVVFLHVPGGFAEEDLVRGREVVVALIRALVEDGKRGSGKAV